METEFFYALGRLEELGGETIFHHSMALTIRGVSAIDWGRFSYLSPYNAQRLIDVINGRIATIQGGPLASDGSTSFPDARG